LRAGKSKSSEGLKTNRGPERGSHHSIGSNLKRAVPVVNGYVWIQIGTGYEPTG